MCLSALLIFIYSLKISEWVQSGRLGGPPHLRRRAQGEFPEGQEKVPRGQQCCATRLSGGCGRHLRVLSNDECSTAGCDKVNCLLGQEKVPWGTTSAHRIKRLLHAIPQGSTLCSHAKVNFTFSSLYCTTSRGFHSGISESLPETPCRIVLPLRRLRRGRTADRTRLTAVLQPYQRALRWKR